MAIDAGGGCDSSRGCTSGSASADASRAAEAAQAEAAKAEAAKAEAAKAEAAKAEAAKAAAAAVTNSPAVQAAFGVSSFTPASAPPAGMPSLSSSTMAAQIAQAKANNDKVIDHAREIVQNRDRVCYTPEVLDQKVREHLASQPRLEPSRAGPSVSQLVNDAYDRATKFSSAVNQLDGVQDRPRPNFPSRTPPRLGR